MLEIDHLEQREKVILWFVAGFNARKLVLQFRPISRRAAEHQLSGIVFTIQRACCLINKEAFVLQGVKREKKTLNNRKTVFPPFSGLNINNVVNN